MKVKMIDCSYDKDTGFSKVTLADRYGQYTGIAKLHPDDKEYGTEIAGCRLAELRAWKKYYRAQVRRTKSIIKGIDALGLALAKDPNIRMIEDISTRYTKVLHQYKDNLEMYELCIEDIDNLINYRIDFKNNFHKGKNK